MCSGGIPKAPPPPVIPPPPPPPELNDQLAPVTAANDPRRRKATLQSFRSDLAIPAGQAGLNIPR